MPAFDVTANPTTLTVKPGEKKTIVVTATNRLGRPVTARAKAVVDPSTGSAWVKPPANAQQSFNQANATLEFQFGLEVPATAAAGLYKVRFDVVDVDLPDDNFGQSPMIAVTVPKAEVVVPTPPPNRWWIWAIAAAVVLGAGFGIWKAFFSSKEPPPPTRLGPAGGKDGGEEFTDLCDNVVAVHVRDGWFIDAIQLVCLDPNGTPISSPRRGGPGGGEKIFELQVGEHITAVSGSAMGPDAPFVFSVQFQTNRRSSPVYGNQGPTKGQEPFTFSVPAGGRFRGLFGRSGQYLVALGALVSQAP